MTLKFNGSDKNKNGNGLRIVTHEHVFGAERERTIAKGLREHAYYRNRPGYSQRRTWDTSNEDKERRFGKFRFRCPEWLVPAAGILGTVTASIVWGLCGRKCEE